MASRSTRPPKPGTLLPRLVCWWTDDDADNVLAGAGAPYAAALVALASEWPVVALHEPNGEHAMLAISLDGQDRLLTTPTGAVMRFVRPQIGMLLTNLAAAVRK